MLLKFKFILFVNNYVDNGGVVVKLYLRVGIDIRKLFFEHESRFVFKDKRRYKVKRFYLLNIDD